MVATGISKGVCPFDIVCDPFVVVWWHFYVAGRIKYTYSIVMLRKPTKVHVIIYPMGILGICMRIMCLTRSMCNDWTKW